MTKTTKTLIYPVPWDVTTTYHTGSSNGPNQMKHAYHQLDDCHPFLDSQIKLEFFEPNPDILNFQAQYSSPSHRIIHQLNHNKKLTKGELAELKKINQACFDMNQVVENDCLKIMKNGPFILVGGEHGVGLGYVRALSSKYSTFGVLQIDAHMDCRVKYLGYDYSHASVMTHYSDIDAIKSITQVGIRDFDLVELEFQKKSLANFYVFNDYDSQKRMFNGEGWGSICQDIIDALPDDVFISCDIDGLSPSLCPGTGTPVPGGLDFNQLTYLLDRVYSSKKVIGAELVEVSNLNQSDWDANVGVRVLKILAGILR